MGRLFKVNEDKVSVLTKVINGIEFKVFNNTMKLFERYNEQQEEYMFTNCFEYINKNNLNSKYDILYLEDDIKIYLFIYHKHKDTLIAYNFESYEYYLQKYGIKLKIKFASEYNLDNIANYKTGTEIVDAIYELSDEGLCTMQGKEYANLRKKRNHFENKNKDIVFRKYNDKDMHTVLALYQTWKNIKKSENHMIVDAKIFKSGLNSNYLEKFVLCVQNKIIGFASYYKVKDYIYMFSMKTTRDKDTLRNTNVYMVYLLWNHIRTEYPDAKFINLGGIDNPGWCDDFKEQLKPDIYLVNYINVEIKEK